jgi:myosin-15
METRKKSLEQQLEAVEWGTQKRREPVSKKPIPIAPPLPQPQTGSGSPEPVLIPRVEATQPAMMDAERAFDIHAMDGLHTALYAQIAEPFYTYVRVPWTLDIRKEVFSPLERLENSTVVHLVFIQIVQDLFSNDCIRFNKEERRGIMALLESNGIHQRNLASHLHTLETKTRIIEAAKDTPFYFSRLFPVNGGSRHRNLHLVGVSHSGVRLITRCKDMNDDRLSVMEHIKFEEILEVYIAKPSTAVMRLGKRSIVLYSYLAPQIVNFIKAYQAEAEKVSWYHNGRL